MQSGHKRYVDQKVKKNFFLRTDILTQAASSHLRCSAARHHFVVFPTGEVQGREAESSEESCTVPLPW